MIKKIFLFILIFMACDKEMPNYYYLNFDLKPLSKIISLGDTEEGKENGFWTIVDQDTNIITYGYYHHGLKVGKWHYSKFNDSLYWKILEDSTIRVNVPAFLNRNNSDVLNAYSDKYNLLIKKLTAKTSWDYHLENRNQVLNHYDTVLNYEEYRITNEKDTSFFSVYKIAEETERYSIICYVSTTASGMYGIALRAPAGNSLMQKRIFFDILEGCYIKKDRVYNPFVYSKIEKL